jgi:hypothetical protein
MIIFVRFFAIPFAIQPLFPVFTLTSCIISFQVHLAVGLTVFVLKPFTQRFSLKLEVMQYYFPSLVLPPFLIISLVLLVWVFLQVPLVFPLNFLVFLLLWVVTAIMEGLVLPD